MRRRGWLLCAALMMVLCQVHMAYCAIDVIGPVQRIATGIWSGTTRIIPAMVDTGAGVAWVASRLNWSSVALIGAGLVGAWMVDHYADQYGPAIRDFLSANNYRINSDGTVEKKTGAQVYQPAVEGMADSLESWLSAKGYVPYIINWYPSQNPAIAMDGWWEQGRMTDIPWGGGYVAPMVGVGQIYRHNPHTTSCTVGIGNRLVYIIGAYPTGDGAVVAADEWANRTSEEMAVDIIANLQDGTITEAEKAWFASVVEKAIIDALANNPGKTDGDVMGRTVPGGGTIASALKEGVEAGTDGDAESKPTEAAKQEAVEVQKTGVYDAPYSGGAAKTSAWPEVPSIGEQLGAFIASLKTTSLFGLPGQIGAGISAGSPVVSFSAGVFGSQTYDFSTWPSEVTNCIKGLLLVCCMWVAVKIVTIKGG